MRYIVWTLISPHDGYGTTECSTWEEVCKAVEREAVQPWHEGGKEKYEAWLSGKTNKIIGHKLEVFVTTEALLSPVITSEQKIESLQRQINTLFDVVNGMAGSLREVSLLHKMW